MRNLAGCNFLTLLDFDKAEIQHLLKLSHQLKQKKHLGEPSRSLRNKNVVLLFEKPSTRTRCAFELAGKQEGANVTVLTNSHTGKKESIEDTAQVLGRYYDGILFRGFEQKTVVELAKYAGVPVWNGLTNEFHPSQALADVMTIEEMVKKPLAKVKLVYVGDLRNNVAISLMIISAKLGMQFTGLGPELLYPEKHRLEVVTDLAQKSGGSVRLTDNFSSGLVDADVIYTDVWVSMGEEKEMAARIDLLKRYQVNSGMLTSTKNPDTIFMHCLPACHNTQTELGNYAHKNFGLSAMEVTDKVFRSPASVVYTQAENRMHTAKAIMLATLIDSFGEVIRE